MKNFILSLAFTLIGTFAFANTSESALEFKHNSTTEQLSEFNNVTVFENKDSFSLMESPQIGEPVREEVIIIIIIIVHVPK